MHPPSLHDSAHAVAFSHPPSGPHVWKPLPKHCVSLGTHMPAHVPLTHAWFEQVARGLSETRSGPHCTAVVAFEQMAWLGIAFMHVGSMAAQVPWVPPVRLSQFWPAGHVERSAQVPPLQMSVWVCPLPLHASWPSCVQAHPTPLVAPVEASPPALQETPPSSARAGASLPGRAVLSARRRRPMKSLMPSTALHATEAPRPVPMHRATTSLDFI